MIFKRRTLVLCLAAVGILPASRAWADAERAMATHPWAEGAWGETNDRLLYQTQGHVKGEKESDSQVFWWDSVGRFRFDTSDPHPLALGYHWATMDFGTNSSSIPNHLDDISLAGAVPLFSSGTSRTSVVLGAGYSSDNPFANINGLYGIGHLVHEIVLGKGESLFLTLDYNGNNAFLPDVPLPGFTYVKRSGDVTLGVGFPESWVSWEFAPRWKVTASYDVPYTADARVEYNVTRHVSLFGGYSNFFHAFSQDDHPTTDRVFYEMSRAEAGVRYNGTIKGFQVDAALVVGYAFEQSFYTGFDVRNLDAAGRLSDEPYIGIQLLSRF